MVKRVFPAPAFNRSIHVTEFRNRLAHYVAEVRHGGDFVVIRRKGEDNVYLIGQADWDLMRQKFSELESGKRNPKTGACESGLWWLLNWDHRWQMAEEWLAARRQKKVQKKLHLAKPMPSSPPQPRSDTADPYELMARAAASLEEMDEVKPLS